eukprot:Colp12_sorted_trinity150504_noHs@8390
MPRLLLLFIIIPLAFSTEPVPSSWPNQWRATADFTCTSTPQLPCFNDSAAPDEDVTVSFTQYYDWDLRVHRVDHQPRCFPFTQFGEPSDSRPCTVWFDSENILYDDFQTKTCCIMAAGVPLLNPAWTWNATAPAASPTYLGTNRVDNQAVNGFGPYPTNLYYFETVPSKDSARGRPKQWTSDVTILDLVWFENLAGKVGKTAWWREHLTVPDYCKKAPLCPGADSLEVESFTRGTLDNKRNAQTLEATLWASMKRLEGIRDETKLRVTERKWKQLFFAAKRAGAADHSSSLYAFVKNYGALAYL